MKPQIDYQTWHDAMESGKTDCIETTVGNIQTVEFLPKNKKMIKMVVKFSEDDTRTVISNIGDRLESISLLKGLDMPFVTNLIPTIISKHESQAMIVIEEKDGNLILPSTKFKHTPNHSVKVEITEALIKSFTEEANEIINKAAQADIKKGSGIKLNEDSIKGYVLAKVHAYIKNNGVPPIPFPVSFSTVDVAAMSFHDDEFFLLLGRKPGQTTFQFPGGFRDPKEINKGAAKRELNEETHLIIEQGTLEMVDQLFIDDKRYVDSCHKVTTTLFISMLSYGVLSAAKAGDDLQEVRIFKLNDLIKDPSIVRDIHQPLFELLWKYILSVPDQAKYISTVAQV